MKYHILTKLLAILLAAVCFTGAVMGLICVVYNANYGYYFESPTSHI